jgi:hypothetical protein
LLKSSASFGGAVVLRWTICSGVLLRISLSESIDHSLLGCGIFHAGLHTRLALFRREIAHLLKSGSLLRG